MSTSPSDAASAFAPNCGCRREAGCERTSATVWIAVFASVAISSSIGLAPWPTDQMSTVISVGDSAGERRHDPGHHSRSARRRHALLRSGRVRGQSELVALLLL